MKKLKFILPLLAIGVLFVGCGKKEKDEYIETYQKLSNITEFNEQEIKVKIDDFQLDMDEDENEGQASMYMNMITSQLKDMDISGKVTINSKEQLMKMNLDMKGFGSTMNFSGFIDDKALYLSGTYLADLFNLSKDLTGTEMMDEETTDELKNR